MRNTKKKGTIEFLFYKEKSSRRYVGVCLTFDIVEEGSNLAELRERLFDAAAGHIIVVRKEHLSDELLNRPAPKKYWDIYYMVLKKEAAEKQAQDFPEIIKIPIQALLSFLPQQKELVRANATRN